MKKLLFVLGLFFVSVVSARAQTPEPQYVELTEEEQFTLDNEGTADLETIEISEPGKIVYKAEVLEVKNVECIDETDGTSCLEVKLKLLDGEKKGEEVTVNMDTRSDVLAKEWDLKTGKKMVVTEFNFGETSEFQITEVYRTNSILWFVAIYVILVLIVGRWQGFGSLVGLVFSVFVILKVTIPMTLNGYDPISVSIFGGFLVLVPSLYLSHGFNKKTTIALVGTTIGLILTGVLAYIAIGSASLTGFGNEEALYLVSGDNINFNMQSILLASMIIGGIGLIDDVTVGQVAVIKEIFDENKQIDVKKLYSKAMNVGKDHIASMVNTLFLAYAAASLPLLMLLVNSGADLENISNIETFSEEIIRTLVASSGLVLTMPITTLVGSWYYIRGESGKNRRY
ncbi:YibE/F family protein [Candidatus Dojkabacteria bacterium]|nr:YibE/F family protein [Candidatus Dojkabacteria bacterium]